MGKGGPTFKKVGPPCVFAPIPILSVAAVAVALKIVQSGREKSPPSGTESFEHFTRVTCGIFAFLVRDAKVVGRYHHLHLALQLHDGEQTQRDVDLLADRHILEAAAHLGTDLAGMTAPGQQVFSGHSTYRHARQMGSTICTTALGMAVSCSLPLQQPVWEEKTRAFASLPYRMTFLEK